MSIAAWDDRGHRVDVDGKEVFYVDVGAGEAIVFLHGYPSSSYDLHLCIDALAANHRVIAHDHIGFGLSSKPDDFSYTLQDQARVTIELWKELGLEHIHLIGHDYGQTVVAEVLALRDEGALPVSVTTVTLCNGSTLVELAQMSRLQRLASMHVVGDLLVRLSNRWIFRRQIRRILGDNAAVPDAEIDAMFELMTRDGGRRVWSRIARYNLERRRLANRFVGAIADLDLPCHILWGRLDPVAIAPMATELADLVDGSVLTWLETLGHYPMIEGPVAWAEAVLGFIEAH